MPPSSNYQLPLTYGQPQREVKVQSQAPVTHELQSAFDNVQLGPSRQISDFSAGEDRSPPFVGQKVSD